MWLSFGDSFLREGGGQLTDQPRPKKCDYQADQRAKYGEPEWNRGRAHSRVLQLDGALRSSLQRLRGIFQYRLRGAPYSLVRGRPSASSSINPLQAAACECVGKGAVVVSEASSARTKEATRVPSSSIARNRFACANSATLIWNVRREMPPNDSFTPRIFSATVSGSPTISAPVGPISPSNCARVTGGQARSFPISDKLRP